MWVNFICEIICLNWKASLSNEATWHVIRFAWVLLCLWERVFVFLFSICRFKKPFFVLFWLGFFKQLWTRRTLLANESFYKSPMFCVKYLQRGFFPLEKKLLFHLLISIVIVIMIIIVIISVVVMLFPLPWLSSFVICYSNTTCVVSAVWCLQNVMKSVAHISSGEKHTTKISVLDMLEIW